MKLGKHPPERDQRTLRFGDYVRGEPPPPPAVDYGKRVSSWPMYANDKVGDCTAAAAGHMIQSWTANAGAEVTPPEQAVLAFWQQFVGSPPPPPPNDGCPLLRVLKGWRATGLDGHRVKAFAELERRNHAEAMSALQLFGSIYVGIALPDFATAVADPRRVPWMVPAQGATGSAAPDPHNGHCVPAVAYDDAGLYVVTWGMVKPMSWPFYDGYVDEVYAVLSEDFLAAGGTTTAGFDLAQLEADLARL